MTCPRCNGFMVKDDVRDFFIIIRIMRCVNCSHTIDIKKALNDHSNMRRHRVDKSKARKTSSLQFK